LSLCSDLLNLALGDFFIDGHKIDKLGLHQVIKQRYFALGFSFRTVHRNISGQKESINYSTRSNLICWDAEEKPFDEYEDSNVWLSLQQVSSFHLQFHVKKLFKSKPKLKGQFGDRCS
jgi:hypothetical protein